MIIIIGLVVLVAAVIIGVAGVAANLGEVRTSTSDFGIFDYHFTASPGELFLYGMAIGAIGMIGLSLLLAGAWRSSRRGSAARRELRQSRREMASQRRSTPPAGSPPPPDKQPPGQTVTPPSEKPVWSWNRFMRQPTGSKPVETSGRSPVETTK